MFYAFTVGSFLELGPGECAEVNDAHCEALVRWLHALPGMNFDIITNAELQPVKGRYRKEQIDFFLEHGIDLEHIDTNQPDMITVIPKQPTAHPAAPAGFVPPPAYTPPSVSALEKILSQTTVQDLSELIPVDSTPTTQQSVAPRPSVTRRPAPPPPAALARVRVIYDFTGRDGGELDVHSGQILTVFKDLGDGWLKARAPTGASGLVPKSYTLAL